jgi:hypothetical protein
VKAVCLVKGTVPQERDPVQIRREQGDLLTGTCTGSFGNVLVKFRNRGSSHKPVACPALGYGLVKSRYPVTYIIQGVHFECQGNSFFRRKNVCYNRENGSGIRKKQGFSTVVPAGLTGSYLCDLLVGVNVPGDSQQLAFLM